MKTFQHLFDDKILSQFDIVEIDIEVRKKKRRRHLSIFHPFVPMSSLLVFRRGVSIVHNIINGACDYLKAKTVVSISNGFKSTSHIGYNNTVIMASLPLSGIKRRN